MTVKRCPTCGVTKPLDGFYRNKSRKNGRSDQCKECRKASARAYYGSAQEDVKARHEAYQGNREKINAYQRAYHFANREKRNAARRERYEMIGDLYGDKCQEISMRHATRNGEPWSEAEDNFIINSTDRIIDDALALHRTYRSVERRRSYLRRAGVIEKQSA